MTREEAIEALTSKDVHNSDKMLEALDMAVKALEQEPRKGHWKRWYEDNKDMCGERYMITHCQCSECDKEYDFYTTQFIKFCSNCGAKMQEVHE